MIMADKRVLTGLDWAFVKTKRPAPDDFVQVYEGDELPADIAAGEIDRLDKLGAFGDHPRVAYGEIVAAQLAAQEAAGVVTNFDVAPGDDDTDEDADEDDDGESGNSPLA